VQVKGKEGRILRSNNRTRWDQDRGRKDERSVGLADFSRDQEYIEGFGTS